MECSKCLETRELIPKRKICRICYNAEKKIQRNNKLPEEREDECTKCFEVKLIPKGKRWCKSCKNEYEKKRKEKLSDEQKKEINEKSKTYYEKTKEDNKNKKIIIDVSQTKICTTCNEEKTSDMFYIAKCKGTIRSQCKSCSSNARKQYYKEHRKETINQTSTYKIQKCKTDPAFKLERNLRCRLYHALRSQTAKKSTRTLDLIGCTVSYLMGYLEAKFTEGMTWKNHGEWHIDHIKPCCKFNLLNEEEQKQCFHYTNLQPLWAKENLTKGGQFITIS